MNGLAAAENACAVADRSELGRLIASGPDVLGLLHRLSTGNVKDLQPGEGCATVVTNAKGRIVERLFVHHLGPHGVLLVAGENGAPRVQAHLDKFTFAEDTGLADVTAGTFAYVLFGPLWTSAAASAGFPDLAPYGAAPCTIAGFPAHAARTNGFDADGLLLFGPRDHGEPVRAALLAAALAQGGGMIDRDEVEAWRILRGLPKSGHELTDEHNPLEAGLRDAVSFTKGCYIGQEVIARLNTYGKVSRSLVRLDLRSGAPVPARGSAVLLDDREIGAVTSAVLPAGRSAPVALAFVKSRELTGNPVAFVIDDAGARQSATLAASVTKR